MAEQREELIKETFLLPKRYVDDLVKMAEGSNVDHMLVKAIATSKLFEEEERRGVEILLQGPDRSFERVRLP